MYDVYDVNKKVTLSKSEVGFLNCVRVSKTRNNAQII